MRIFKNAWFVRFAHAQNISDDALREAVLRAESGQVDADLGGGVVKQRIARSGQGKSSGYRTIILLRAGYRAFFVYGFAKSDRENIRYVLPLSDLHVSALIDAGQFVEVKNNGEKISK